MPDSSEELGLGDIYLNHAPVELEQLEAFSEGEQALIERVLELNEQVLDQNLLLIGVLTRGRGEPLALFDAEPDE